MPAPASSSRIAALDLIRGVAVLGILAVNIAGFAGPMDTTDGPALSLAGHASFADEASFAAIFLLFEGKMRALFTMLFGASTVLIAERAEGARPGPAQTHYRRMFWLFVIGMLHAYFLWWGDILVTYALAGLMIFPFRKLEVRTQVTIGVAVLGALLALTIDIAIGIWMRQ